MGNVPTWLVWVIGLLLVVNVGALIFTSRGEEVDLSGIESQLAANTAAIKDIQSQPAPAPDNQTPTIISQGPFTLNKQEFEDQAIEDEALRLATESVNSKDFKKAALVALEEFDVSGIESYRDITVKLLDVDVDEDEVTFDVKLLYFLDGDEEETESARLVEFVVNVDDLDFDEDFVDAEVDESYFDGLEILRVYD